MTKASNYTKAWRERYIAFGGLEKYREYRRDEARKRRLVGADRRAAMKVKRQMIEAYGGECVCCGERRAEFLTIDHIDNSGAQHRREVLNRTGSNAGGGRHFYSWLRRNGWPKENLRLMCFNCNCGRNTNGGVCPHETEASLY